LVLLKLDFPNVYNKVSWEFFVHDFGKNGHDKKLHWDVNVVVPKWWNDNIAKAFQIERGVR
jgi:hypothetical protein